MKYSISKEKIAHEVVEFLIVFLFIAPIVLTLATQRIFLGTSESALFVYGAALLNALMLSKIVLTGEFLGLGKSSENRQLIVPTLYKSVAFSLLYAVSLGLESTVHGLLHGRDVVTALGAAFVTDRGEILIRVLMTVFAAVPFFALREVRRMLGVGAFRALFFGSGRLPNSDGLRERGQKEPAAGLSPHSEAPS
jgi:hypothetical protein